MTSMTPEKMQTIIEAALMVAGQPLTITTLQHLFSEETPPSTTEIKDILAAIQARYQDSGIELQEVASGYRLQAKGELSPWLSKLWEERAPRYSRAFLETLAIIAYKQPVTRAEIEEVRGVTVSSNIMKTLQEREWIRVLGYREVPGRPAIYGTTKTFLDYFNLKSLTELPTLAEFKNLEAQEAQLQVQLAIENSDLGPENSEMIPPENTVTVDEENSEENSQEEDVEIENNIITLKESIESVEHKEADTSETNLDNPTDEKATA